MERPWKEGPFDVCLEVRDHPVDHGKRCVAVCAVAFLLLEAPEGRGACGYAAPGIRPYPRHVAEMVMPELAPGASRAVLRAADDARPLPGRRPVHGCKHRLLLRAAPARAMGLRPYAGVVRLDRVSSKDAGRTPIWPWRSGCVRAPVRRSCSCSLSASAGRMRSRLPSGRT